MTATFQRVLFGLVFLFVMVNVHEIGHTTVARLLGDDSAHYVLYQVQGQSGCLGCNLYDSSRLGDLANVFVNLGGVIFTQLLCWIARSRAPHFPQKLNATGISVAHFGQVSVAPRIGHARLRPRTSHPGVCAVC